MYPVEIKSKYKYCRHCDPENPHVIKECKAKNQMGKQVRQPAQWEKVKVFQEITGRVFLLDDWLCPRFQMRLRDFARKHCVQDTEQLVNAKENIPSSPNVITTRSKPASQALLSLMDPPPRKYKRRSGPPGSLETSKVATSSCEDPSPFTSGTSKQPSEQMDYDMNGEANVQISGSETDVASSVGTPIQPEAVYSDMSESDSQLLFSQATTSSGGNMKKTAKIVLDDGLHSVPFSESCCLICGKTSKQGRKTVPGTAKKDLWLVNNIYLPRGVRSCLSHLSEDIFCDAAKDVLEKKKRVGVKITKSEIAEWIKWLTNFKVTKSRTIDFDDAETPDEAYVELLGLKKDHFDELLGYIKDGLHKSANRSPRNALGIFLSKLRLGVSQRVIARLFGIKSQVSVSQTFHRVLQLLVEKFVPENLGFKHLSREDILKDHNPSFVRRMFEMEEGKLVFILDGTYFYIQSSGDFILQSRTYSSHKHRNLVKFMQVITPDGYILDCVGPFPSDGLANDAKILRAMLNPDKCYNKDGSYTDDPLMSLVEPSDHFILDRGFRDVRKDLTELGIISSAPLFLEKGQKAFSCEEANRSRKVTMVRWPVEAINGKLKNKFDFLDNIIPNSYLPSMKDIVRVSSAILNKFGNACLVESEKHQKLLEQVEERLEMPNLLADKVVEFKLKLNVKWRKASATAVLGFPKLTDQDVREITLGPYQKNQGERYIERDVKLDPLYTVLLHKEEAGIIRIKLKSRFRRAVTHNVWIEFNDDESRKPSSRILGWFCGCEQGARNLGCCSHIASVLLYLGRDVHEPGRERKKRMGTSFLLDCAEKTVQREARLEDENVLECGDEDGTGAELGQLDADAESDDELWDVDDAPTIGENVLLELDS